MRERVYTIGYSIHPWETFLGLLQQHAITAIGDVRSNPSSRQPHYCREELRNRLRQAGIAYVYLGDELGARRCEPECYEQGQVIYERAARLPAFRAGLDRVWRGLERYNIALMCAEKEPLDCHRSILIAREIQAAGVPVMHILADGELEDHRVTEERLIRMTGTERSLFDPDAERLPRAYEMRGRQIAYVEPEGLPPGVVPLQE